MNELNPETNELTTGPGSDALPTGHTGGNVRVGRYHILGTLGRGGMGTVYKAHDPQQNLIVAIKLIDSEAAKDPEARKRFEREARSAMVLDHPRIAQIYSHEKDQDGRPFLVMEYVEGVSLEKYIKDNPDAPYSVLVDFVLQVAQGLDAAHRRAIIHRDIKPSNIIVQPNGHVKIIDFGLAKGLWDQTVITATDMVVGTPRYLSPEQGMGRGVDHRADIYSLGATFYELVTRQSPYDGDTPLAIMMKHINAPLTPPYMINPKIPADINEIICKMMAKDPGQRYQEYDKLISELEQAKIHRMSKEQRLTDEEYAALTGETVLVGSNRGSGPRSYLTEGLVNVKLDDLPTEPEPSKLKLLSLSIVGILIIITALVTLSRAPAPGEGRERSAVARAVLSILGRVEPPIEDKPEDLVTRDIQNISTTRSRMEMAVAKIIEDRAANPDGKIPTMSDLLERKIIDEENSMDAWGNQMVVTSAQDGVIKSFGRDGIEGNDDDLMVTLSGVPTQIPKALTTDEAAILLQK